VYCLEEQDNGADLHLLSVDANAPITEKKMDISGTTVTALQVQGYRKVQPDSSLHTSTAPCAPDTVDRKLPQTAERASTDLYRAYAPTHYDAVTLTYIPYYTWANRGENEMQVWTKLWN
jgi:hypothetical protein